MAGALRAESQLSVESALINGKRIEDIALEDVIRKVDSVVTRMAKIKEDVDGQMAFCVSKMTQLPALEQRVTALSRAVMNSEQRLENESGLTKASLTKFQKHLTSHQAKLTEFAIKLKAIVVLNKEFTLLKHDKCDVEQFE